MDSNDSVQFSMLLETLRRNVSEDIERRLEPIHLNTVETVRHLREQNSKIAKQGERIATLELDTKSIHESCEAHISGIKQTVRRAGAIVAFVVSSLIAVAGFMADLWALKKK